MYTDINDAIYEHEYDELYSIVYDQNFVFEDDDEEEEIIDLEEVELDDDFIPWIECPEYDDTFDMAEA